MLTYSLQHVIQILGKGIYWSTIEVSDVYTLRIHEQVDAKIQYRDHSKVISYIFQRYHLETRLNTDACLNSHLRLTDKQINSQINYSLLDLPYII